MNCFVYDTCGQERYRAINSQYFRKANAILLLYDITSKKSFDEVKDYYSKEIRERCNKNIPVVLIGNKLDKEDEREVSQDEAISLAKKERYDFRETSCKTNKNVANALEALIELWNNVEKKKRLIGERANSGEFIKTKKREKNEKISYKERTATIAVINKTQIEIGKSFVLTRSNKKDIETKKKCSC